MLQIGHRMGFRTVCAGPGCELKVGLWLGRVSLSQGRLGLAQLGVLVSSWSLFRFPNGFSFSATKSIVFYSGFQLEPLLVSEWIFILVSEWIFRLVSEWTFMLVSEWVFI